MVPSEKNDQRARGRLLGKIRVEKRAKLVGCCCSKPSKGRWRPRESLKVLDMQASLKRAPNK